MTARDTLRQAADDADLEAYADVLIAAFGLARSRAQTLHWASLFRRDDLWLAERDGRVVAGAAIARAEQWWGGRAQPLAGVSGVVTLPEVRGQGVSSRLLRHLHAHARALGFGLAALYASTFPLYRKLGYEQAGSIHVRQIRLRELGRDVGARTLTVLPADRAGIEAYERAWLANHPGDNGQLGRGPFFWGRIFRDDARAVVFARDGRPEGYAVLSAPEPTAVAHVAYDLKAWHAATPAALAHLLAWLRDCAAAADTLTYRGAAVDAITLALPAQSWEVRQAQPWLLRVLDVSTAFTKRGYPAHVRTSLGLNVVDDLVPENAGPWRIEVGDGQAEVHAGATHGTADATLTTDARGLAALFTGAVSARALVQMGRADANAAGIAAADALLAGPAAWPQDMF